ncbi:MAG: acetyl-CoA synthase subunit gamma [Desulfobacteraceae bacterium]|nr:mercury methylation corrinoid protein HgcA [Desulfobacteraceae bacterium]PLX47590.1 MAG: acetyl-CoA synthase subunit gamma [Desulfobacteraceae bacterium]
MNQPFIIGSVKTPTGDIPKISSDLSRRDHWGSIKARWGVGRMHYTVDPGLYALGAPNERSPVLVTANYKMSFDRLREALSNRHAWILVLDTKGINVWCAAGKGTFGTDELVRRIEYSQLNRVVSHTELILPQLAGPGVAAHKVKKRTGFKVLYGPIQATDLPAFLDAGMEATPNMRRKTFTMLERVVLIPVELVSAFKWSLLILPAFFLLGGVGAPSGFWQGVLNDGLFAVLHLLGALLAGAVLTPILLPWLPGRAFSQKGLIMGLITTLFITLFGAFYLNIRQDYMNIMAWFFLAPALSAYLAMNFTGASTYTSLSGVKKEMRWAVPLEIVGGVAGLTLWVGSRFVLP